MRPLQSQKRRRRNNTSLVSSIVLEYGRMARFSDLIQPRFLRPPDAAAYVGGEGMLKRFVAAHWLRPVVRRKRLKLYRRAVLDSCCSRLDTGEFPEVEKARARSEKAFSMP